jgi:hypothetical protein
MRRGFGALALLAAIAAPAAHARPFSFLERPTDQIAMPGYVSGTTVTPEGSLYTGWDELVFRYGPRLRAVDAPVRELMDGRLPVVVYSFAASGVRYTVTVFAAEVGQRPVNFARVVMRNTGRRTVPVAWRVALRHAGGVLKSNGRRAFRFPAPAEPAQEGLYTQPGVAFDPSSVWAFDGDTVTRDSQTLLLFPPAPDGMLRELTLRPGDAAAPVQEDTLFGAVDYSGRLGPAERRQLDFTMPVIPVERSSGDYPAARGGWVQAVNKLQYNSFWLRDAAVITNAFDLAGLHDLARENLDFFPAWQHDNGLFISRAGQYDGLGEALWAIGQHALRAHDHDFAERMLGPVRRAVGWLQNERESEPFGLLPVGDPGDNELVSGHLTGDNFWAADGLREAILLALYDGHPELADQWSRELSSFVGVLRTRLAQAEARTGGWIPPTLEPNGGEDWGNLWAAYPEQVLSATDPAVTATLRHARPRFREGIATYFHGRLLHDYLGFRVFETELLRGEQANLIDGLYAELAHTTSTNGGFETGVRRRGRRELDENLAPHGWFAAEYVTLLRNMLVREDGTNLVLMSALSPSWLRAGRTLAVHGADTLRGHIDFTLQSIRGGAVLRWRGDLFPGTKLHWPVPAAATDVRANGLTDGGRTIVLPAASGRMRVHWRLHGPYPTFAGAAKRVAALYRQREH